MKHDIHLRKKPTLRVALVSTIFVVAGLIDGGIASAQTSRDNSQSASTESPAESPGDGRPPEQFGEKGELAISSDAALTISNTSVDGTSTTTVQLDPAVDYFVVRSLSIGGSLSFDYSSQSGGHATSFGIGPRAGYNFPISEHLSIWPKVGLSIAHRSADSDLYATSASHTDATVHVFSPVLLHPVPHFFAGFGPFLDTDLTGNSKATTFGGKLTIGGWLTL